MLVFIDESGDTGRKIVQGSSRYFVISLVLFEDQDEATACDDRIGLLKRELGYSDRFEFHFRHNHESIRKAFLEAINPYSFTYFAVVIDKDPKKLFGPGFDVKESFYKYACNLVFSNAKPHLDNATVIIDKSGSPDFRSGLQRYLNRKANGSGDRKVIKKLKQHRSESNNLLQVADYVSGIINRKYQNKKGWQTYYKYLSAKEMWVQRWPK